MSIINLFIHTAASRAITPLAHSSAGLSSMGSLNAAGDILQHWIATGGMLAAATPVISLFIVSGSTHAISGLIGRMSSTDTLDPKIASPDAIRTAPILGASPVYSQDASGMIASGMESALPQITLGSMLSQGMSATTTRMQQASQTFQQTLGRNLTEGVSQEQSYARMADIGRTISSQNTSASQFVTSQAKNFMEQFGVAESHSDAVGGILTAKASGSISTGTAIKMLGDLTKGISSTNNDETRRSTSDIDQFISGIKVDQGLSQRLTSQLAQRFSEQSRQGFKETWGDNTSKNLSDSASEVTSVAQIHSKMEQIQKNSGSVLNTYVKKLAGVINQDTGAYNDLNRYFSGHATSKTRQEAAEINDRYQRFGMNPEIADTASKLTALFNTGNHTPEQAASASKAAAGAIYRAYGIHPDLDIGKQGEEPLANILSSHVKEMVGSGPDGSRNRNQLHTQANTSLTPDDAVEQDNQKNIDQLQQQFKQANKQVSEPAERKARSNLMHTLPEMSRAASSWGMWDNSTAWLGRRRDQLGDALFAGSDESVRVFNNAMNQLSTLTPEQRDQFITATKNGNQELQQSTGGKLAAAALKLGNNVIGAATTGYDQAQQWLSGKSKLSEAAKTMTLEERGAYYSAAFTAAADAGTKETVRFMQEYGGEFKQTLAETVQHRYGLTPSQAAIYAESFDTNKEEWLMPSEILK